MEDGWFGSPMKTYWMVNTASANHDLVYVDHAFVHGLY
jgi:hypothetical protein